MPLLEALAGKTLPASAAARPAEPENQPPLPEALVGKTLPASAAGRLAEPENQPPPPEALVGKTLPASAAARPAEPENQLPANKPPALRKPPAPSASNITVLGIETSCDDTSVSVAQSGGAVLFLKSKRQLDIHKHFGGIVPELASRSHSAFLLPLIEEALAAVPLSKVDGIAASTRPGLLGALLAGSMTGQTLALFQDKPFVGVNHIEAHIFSPFLNPSPPGRAAAPGGAEAALGHALAFPFLALVVSGSHTHLYRVNDFANSALLGGALDDAAGEALDKLGKMLGFPWPGGPHIDRIAGESFEVSRGSARGPLAGRGLSSLGGSSAPGGAAAASGRVCRPALFSKIRTSGLSFSFSGLKSAARRLLDRESSEWGRQNQTLICQSYLQTAVDHLMEKAERALKETGLRRLAVSGGVSANRHFRKRLQGLAAEIYLPQKIYACDNAAMIAYTGANYLRLGKGALFSSGISPRHFEKDFFAFSEGL